MYPKLLIALTMLCSSITNIHAQCISSGVVQAATFTNDGGIGTIPFSNPLFAQLSDANSAAAPMLISLLSTKTNYLKAVNFNPAIGGSATICGIEIEIQKRATGINILTSVSDGVVRLIKNGIIVGTNKPKSGKWPTTDTYFTYGSNSDLWGTTLTPADVNSSNFGIALSADLVGVIALLPTARINHIRMTIYYMVTILPVKLISFDASKLNGNKIQLKWITQNEQDVSKYTIEHSANGTDWQAVYETTPLHTEPENKYAVQLPVTGSAKNYYRLIMRSIDGNRQVSPVKIISNKTGNSFQVITGYNTIDIRNIVSKEQALIFDLQGRQVCQKTVYPGNSNQVDISTLSKGIYFLKIGEETQRFCKL